MKKYLCAVAVLFALQLQAQDFSKNIGTAKDNYAKGNLQDAHFALLQAMQELDIELGKEILKLFPTSLDTLQAQEKETNVSGNSHFTGVTVQKRYGSELQGNLNVIINSPMLTALNAYIASPLMAGFMDPNQKVVKVAGYKGKLIKENEETKTYKLELPLNSALLTLELPNTSESAMLNIVNKMPIDKIAKLLQ